jgi:hypothetical protein
VSEVYLGPVEVIATAALDAECAERSGGQDFFAIVTMLRDMSWASCTRSR